jgi:hypothetical protein
MSSAFFRVLGIYLVYKNIILYAMWHHMVARSRAQNSAYSCAMCHQIVPRGLYAE